MLTGSVKTTKVTRDLTDSNVHTSSDCITSALDHLYLTFCTPQSTKQHMNMKINKVVVMYLDKSEIVRPAVPPDVSVVKGILSSYIFLFLDTPNHYCMSSLSGRKSSSL